LSGTCCSCAKAFKRGPGALLFPALVEQQIPPLRDGVAWRQSSWPRFDQVSADACATQDLELRFIAPARTVDRTRLSAGMPTGERHDCGESNALNCTPSAARTRVTSVTRLLDVSSIALKSALRNPPLLLAVNFLCYLRDDSSRAYLWVCRNNQRNRAWARKPNERAPRSWRDQPVQVRPR
jgi:hypothetical protein